MKKFTLVPTETVSAITCDCCKTSFTRNDLAWYEVQSIEFTAGYGSIFGDGKTISIDLCQDCLKRTLGQWLRVSSESRNSEVETIPDGIIDALRESADRANASIDDMTRFVEKSDHRIAGMEAAGSQAKSIELSDEIVSIENLKGILHKPGSSSVTIEDMRLGWSDEQGPQHRKRYTLEELLAQTPDKLPLVEGWDDMVPVGREFGADNVRFTRVLQCAISVFGNPLEAVQWLTGANPLFGGDPMKSVIDSEDGCNLALKLLFSMVKES